MTLGPTGGDNAGVGDKHELASPDPRREPASRALTVRSLFVAAMGVLAVVLVLFLLWRLLYQVLLVLTAIILAEGLRPAVSRLNRGGLRYGLATAVAYGALVASVAAVTAVLAGPVITGLLSLTGYTNEIAQNIDGLLQRVEISGQQLASLAGTVIGAAGGLATGLLRVGGGIVGLVGDLILILILSITWMTASRDLKAFVLSLLSDQQRPLGEALMAETSRVFSGYVRGVAVNMVAIGALATFACWLLRLPAPVLLGTFAGLCELIPMLGPFLGAVPAVLLGFTVGPIYPLVVALAFLVLQQIESNVLTPVVMKANTGLRPFVVIAALLVGGALAGVWGALVAVPVAAALQLVIVRVIAPAIRMRQRPIRDTGDADLAGEGGVTDPG